MRGRRIKSGEKLRQEAIAKISTNSYFTTLNFESQFEIFWIEINDWAKRRYFGIREGTRGKVGNCPSAPTAPLFKGHGGQLPPLPPPSGTPVSQGDLEISWKKLVTNSSIHRWNRTDVQFHQKKPSSPTPIGIFFDRGFSTGYQNRIL